MDRGAIIEAVCVSGNAATVSEGDLEYTAEHANTLVLASTTVKATDSIPDLENVPANCHGAVNSSRHLYRGRPLHASPSWPA